MKAAMAVRGEATLPVVSSPPRPGNLFDRDGAIIVDSKNYGAAEDLHQGAMHALAQYIRQLRMTTNTISTTVL
jgi:hypothetical protein